MVPEQGTDNPYVTNAGPSGAFRRPDDVPVKQQRKVLINTSSCRGPTMECLTEVISKRQGFELVDDGKRKFDDIYFVITRESLVKRIKNMGKKACVSRIPGMYASCTNTKFAECMAMSLRLLPHSIRGVVPFWLVTTPPNHFVVR